MNRYTKPELVVCGLIQRGNTYLLTRRSKNDPEDGDLQPWQIPGGGLEYKESIKQGLQRELKEELSVDIEIKQLISVEEEIRETTGWHGVMLFYLCSLPDKQTIKLNFECCDYKWFTLEKVETLSTFKETAIVIKKAQALQTNLS